MFKNIRKFLDNLTGKSAKEWEQSYNTLLIKNTILKEDLDILELDYKNLEFINTKVNENLDKERKKVKEFDGIINNLIDEKLEIQKQFIRAEQEIESHYEKEYQLIDKIKTLNAQIKLLHDEIELSYEMRQRLLKEISEVKQDREEIKWELISTEECLHIAEDKAARLKAWLHIAEVKATKLEDWLHKGYQELIVDVK